MRKFYKLNRRVHPFFISRHMETLIQEKNHISNIQAVDLGCTLTIMNVNHKEIWVSMKLIVLDHSLLS